MADPSLFDAVRIPSNVLVALDNRTFHFALQPWHYLVRMLHVLSMGMFFGGIALLDLQLLGSRPALSLPALADFVMPWVYATFAVTMVTGAMLFLYDPVRVGSHAYFAPKLILILFGLGNAVVFNHYSSQQKLDKRPPPAAKLAGALSLALWTGVIVCAALNVEGPPKVWLR